MDSKLFAVCGIVALLLVGTTGAVAGGVGPAPTADRGASTGTFPTNPTGSSSGGDATTNARPFTVVAENTEKCGRTCRDVTSTVTNEQEETAENVSVSTRIYAGKTASGDPVWQGAADVGTLEAGESHTATERIKLGFGAAISVKRADGWLTIETTVDSADETVTLTERRDVT